MEDKIKREKVRTDMVKQRKKRFMCVWIKGRNEEIFALFLL